MILDFLKSCLKFLLYSLAYLKGRKDQGIQQILANDQKQLDFSNKKILILKETERLHVEAENIKDHLPDDWSLLDSELRDSLPSNAKPSTSSTDPTGRR